MISQDVGYDAGKNIHGRKRHLSVDLLGLVLRVLVTSASVPEREEAKKVLRRVHRMEEKVNRLNTRMVAIGDKTLCGGLWICFVGLWKLSLDHWKRRVLSFYRSLGS